MLKILIGNLFQTNAHTLVNTVNCVGIMGKGIAKEFKERYPDMYKEYVLMCKQGDVKPGCPYFYQDMLGTSIINFPTKDHWRSPSRLSYIAHGLKWFVKNYEYLGITSIAFPPLGCGNGGLSWKVVGPMMYHYLKPLPIDIEIYAPYGTPLEELNSNFLEVNLLHNAKEVLGSKNIPFNSNWMMILETIKCINSQKYVLPVGRTIIQKIAYILTILDVDTGFHFTKGTFGPYCPDVKQAIASFANANLITETKIGQMIRIDVTENYMRLGKLYTAHDICAVTKTVDLFSRIKDTAHAELFTTVIFSYRALTEKSNVVTEEDINKYILNWKPHWKDEVGKQEKLAEAIRDLSLLNWIHPSTEYGLLTEYDCD